MRILHVEKLLDASLDGQGGVRACVERLSELQRLRGHEVFRFGCVGPAGPADMPRYFDFAATRSPLALPRMIHNPEASARLRAFLRRQPIDVAHLHNIYHHLTPAILPVLAERGIGIVMTVHDYRLACPTKHFRRADGLCTRCSPGRFHHAASPRCAGTGGAALAIESFVQRLLRRYFRWVDFFLCPTRYMREVLVGCGVPRSKAVVVPLPVRSISRPGDRDRSDRELLYVGRLTEIKGPQLMLELAERISDAKVTLVGGGELLEELRSEAKRRKLSNVTLTGTLAPAEVDRHLARATAVVVPSLCMENSPLAMLEAMSAGRCVIAPDQQPIREWVRDGETGRLFETGDADSLAGVARDVLNDPASRGEMESAASAMVARKHDPDRIVERTDSLYREAIRRCGLR